MCLHDERRGVRSPACGDQVFAPSACTRSSAPTRRARPRRVRRAGRGAGIADTRSYLFVGLLVGERNEVDLRRELAKESQRAPVEGLDRRARGHAGVADRGDQRARKAGRRASARVAAGEILVSMLKRTVAVAALLDQREDVGEPRDARAVHRSLLREAGRVLAPGPDAADVERADLIVGAGRRARGRALRALSVRAPRMVRVSRGIVAHHDDAVLRHPQSSSSVVTPSASARRSRPACSPARSPRAPRCPCRSNGLPDSASTAPAPLPSPIAASASARARNTSFFSWIDHSPVARRQCGDDLRLPADAQQAPVFREQHRVSRPAAQVNEALQVIEAGARITALSSSSQDASSSSARSGCASRRARARAVRRWHRRAADSACIVQGTPPSTPSSPRRA